MAITGTPMEIKATRITQMGETLYLASQPANEVTKRAKVDVWSPENPEGYQRELATRRISETVQYLVNGEHAFPTSVLIALRTDIDFVEEQTVGNIAFGTLF